MYEKLLGNIPKYAVWGLKYQQALIAKGHTVELGFTILTWQMMMQPNVQPEIVNIQSISH